MAHCLWTWLRSLGLEAGQDLVECALLLCLIATGVILILTALAGGVEQLFQGAREALLLVGSPVA